VHQKGVSPRVRELRSKKKCSAEHLQKSESSGFRDDLSQDSRIKCSIVANALPLPFPELIHSLHIVLKTLDHEFVFLNREFRVDLAAGRFGTIIRSLPYHRSGCHLREIDRRRVNY